LTRQLLAFSRKQVLQPITFSVNDAMSEMERLLQRVIGKDIEFALNFDPTAGSVLADVGQIEQVVMNLVVNARDAMPDGGVVVLGTARVPRTAEDGTEGWGVQLFVADTGTGMTPDVVAHAFDPFFTTKDPGKGTGLGLSTVYGIVQQSGGDVQIHSRLGMGTRIDIIFPEVAAVMQADNAATAKPQRTRAHGTILLVDDEDPVRRATRRMLEEHGYEVLEARSAREGIEHWRRSSRQIMAIVSDVIMPGLPATVMVEQVRETRPDIPVIFISGHSDAKLVGLVVNERMRILSKPFSATTLLDAVATVTA
jgi:two-component system cell cycle sensor histidine kinase/response regulator CckA